MFQSRITRLPENDLATTVTRDQWALPFLALLGYQARYNSKAFEVDGQSFAVSHRAGEAEDTPPIHVVGARQELGRVPPSGRPRLAPHSLVQEYLNRTEHVWGIVTNGLTLRLLRDSSLVRRQAYIEFDLQAIFEEQRFHDFAALYRLIHRSRLPRGMADANECLLEKYYAQTIEQGGRVREHLRDGVEECLKLLGNGFLTHKDNEELRQKLKSGQLTSAQFYRQLFRIVYRFLFLLVSEDRGLISPNQIYRDHYGIARLRRMLDVQAAWTDHADLWLSLRTLWKLFGDDKLAKILDLAPLNGELFAPQTLDGCVLSNRDLLHAFWHLAYYQERQGAPARRVNYSALDVEELGSVYESLLEFHPDVATDAAGRLQFDLIFGSERKTTGSFYTPPELVNELIESALMPVVRQRLDDAAKADKRDNTGTKHQQAALLSLKIIDIACGSGHMLLAAARRVGKELAKLRTGEDEPAPERIRESIRDVISHCIYGVDRNPLAVDLCRVALWLESHTAGKPLTFLDHRIRCGDSLVGVFDLGVLKQGIPDKAFDPCEGDEKTVARSAAKRNKAERGGEMQELFAAPAPNADIAGLTRHSRDVDAIPDDSPELIRRKKELFEASHRDPAWLRQKQACDLWTAAFFQTLATDAIVSQWLRQKQALPLFVNASVRRLPKTAPGDFAQEGGPGGLQADLGMLMTCDVPGMMKAQRLTLIQAKKLRRVEGPERWGTGFHFKGKEYTQLERLLLLSQQAHYLFFISPDLGCPSLVLPAFTVKDSCKSAAAQSVPLSVVRNGGVSIADFMLHGIIGLWTGDENEKLIAKCKEGCEIGQGPRIMIEIRISSEGEGHQ